MTKPVWSQCFGLQCLDFEESLYSQLPDNLGTIGLVSSGIDFVNIPRLYSDRATL